MMSRANERKTKMLSYPADFTPQEGGEGLGAAFDIGTTTVVGMLWDLRSGKQLAAFAEANPQNEFGMDVISRIDFCGSGNENLELLRSRITGCLNHILGKLCEKTEKQTGDIHRILICGNTTMSHLFAGYPPRTLARAPFSPAYTGTLRLKGREARLDMDEKGEVILLPNIAGHVGGDITAGLLATRALEQDGPTLFIDIGTNGEIVLIDGERTLACSAAAGPAFEGSAILHGMRAAEGAIERVRIRDGEVLFKTIGECKPQGICGSGLIDAIAGMLECRLINRAGRLINREEAEKKGFPRGLQRRLLTEGKERKFVLAPKERGEDIAITQQDIRQVQLAKGAIAAGTSLMLEELGRRKEELERVIVAGAFGSYIDRESAVAIGLLPHVSIETIWSAGNTAGAGVSMALANREECRKAEALPSLIEHVELAEKANFQSTYMSAMAFG